MHSKEWPQFQAHAAALCCFCGKRLRGKPLSSGFAIRDGAWCQNCRSCGHTVHYDLEAEVVDELDGSLAARRQARIESRVEERIKRGDA